MTMQEPVMWKYIVALVLSLTVFVETAESQARLVSVNQVQAQKMAAAA
jgi:hypothetical protein